MNETFARQLLAGQDPLCKRFRHGTTGKWIQIAGVVEDGKYVSLSEAPNLAIFEPMAQLWSQDQTLIARSPMPETAIVRLVRPLCLRNYGLRSIQKNTGDRIRMALGAAPSQVARVVLTRTGKLLAVGMAIGFAMALAAGNFFSQILYGISAHDPFTYFSATALMAVVAFVACWAPARRAIHIDPLTALRAD